MQVAGYFYHDQESSWDGNFYDVRNQQRYDYQSQSFNDDYSNHSFNGNGSPEYQPTTLIQQNYFDGCQTNFNQPSSNINYEYPTNYETRQSHHQPLRVCTEFPSIANCENSSPPDWNNNYPQCSPQQSASLNSASTTCHSSANFNNFEEFKDFNRIDSPFCNSVVSSFSSCSSSSQASSPPCLGLLSQETSMTNSPAVSSEITPLVRRKRGRKPEFAHLPEHERARIKKQKNKEAQRRSRKTKKEQFQQKNSELQVARQRIAELERSEQAYKNEIDRLKSLFLRHDCITSQQDRRGYL